MNSSRTTPNESPPNSPFRFLDLPKEIRLTVYEYLPRSLKHHTILVPLPPPSAAEPAYKTQPCIILIIKCIPTSILATCRAIHHEANSIVQRLVKRFILESCPKLIIGVGSPHYTYQLATVLMEALEIMCSDAKALGAAALYTARGRDKRFIHLNGSSAFSPLSSPYADPERGLFLEFTSHLTNHETWHKLFPFMQQSVRQILYAQQHPLLPMRLTAAPGIRSRVEVVIAEIEHADPGLGFPGSWEESDVDISMLWTSEMARSRFREMYVDFETVALFTIRDAAGWSVAEVLKRGSGQQVLGKLGYDLDAETWQEEWLE